MGLFFRSFAYSDNIENERILFMQPSVSKQIHADLAHKQGFLGKGIGIAYLDTGLFPHKDFSPHSKRIVEFVDFVNQRSTCYDDNGHGTHIAGIAASCAKFDSTYLGIAPQSHIISLKVLDASGNGVQDAFLQGLSWIHQNHKAYQIRLVNISIGSPAAHDSPSSKELLRHVDQLWDDGLIVCIAAGNHGPKPYTISIPGNSPKIITVGSSDDFSPHAFSHLINSGYSGRGPTFSCVMKPDVVAPGTNILSCTLNDRYTLKSGTSMATPVVCASLALLIEKYPFYTNKDVKMKLRNNCDKLKTPRHHQGWGRINLKKLMDL